jgi:hypothetical protein
MSLSTMNCEIGRYGVLIAIQQISQKGMLDWMIIINIQRVIGRKNNNLVILTWEPHDWKKQDEWEGNVSKTPTRCIVGGCENKNRKPAQLWSNQY